MFRPSPSSHSGIFRNDIPSMPAKPQGFQNNRQGWMASVYSDYSAPPQTCATQACTAAGTAKFGSDKPPSLFVATPESSADSTKSNAVSGPHGFLGRLLFEAPTQKTKVAVSQRSSSLPRNETQNSDNFSAAHGTQPLTHREHPSRPLMRKDQFNPTWQSHSLTPPTLSDRVLELKRRDQATQPAMTLSNSPSHSSIMAQSKKDLRQENDASMLEMMSGKANSDVYAPHDVPATRSSDRHSSPNKRLSAALHHEMRGNDLTYLDIKEVVKDLEPNKRLQASSETASSQRQDQRVQAARTLTKHARGLGHALDGDLRGLEQEFHELTKDLETVKAEFKAHLHLRTPRHTPIIQR